MQFSDTLTLDTPRQAANGFLAVRARAARTGVYDYAGRELDPENRHGLRDRALVKVLRDAGTVFDKASAHSFIGKPVTDDHPEAAVTAENWRDHARGTVMNALRDGEFLAFDLLLTDAEAIRKVEAGKRALSNGYTADLEFGDFAAPDGTPCQARQTRIVGNHVALVDRGRAGAACAIGDRFALCDALPASLIPEPNNQEKPVKTITIDGQAVDPANAEAALTAIETLIAACDAAKAKVALLTAEGMTKDAQIATLQQQVQDARPSAAQLRDAGKALLLAAGKARALGVAVTDAMDEAQIMAATVQAKLGVIAQGWNEAQILASFASLTRDHQPGVTPLGNPIAFGDAAAAYAEAQVRRKLALSDAWKQPATAN